jgi:hypothetical protein
MHTDAHISLNRVSISKYKIKTTIPFPKESRVITEFLIIISWFIMTANFFEFRAKSASDQIRQKILPLLHTLTGTCWACGWGAGQGGRSKLTPPPLPPWARSGDSRVCLVALPVPTSTTSAGFRSHNYQQKIYLENNIKLGSSSATGIPIKI